MRAQPILIAYRRFEQLQELLFARDYLIDPGGRDPNEWRDDPPLGLVRPKGVALAFEGDALRSHQSQGRIVAPLVRVAAAGIDQVVTREEQLLELLEAPVGDQDRLRAHGAPVLQGPPDISCLGRLR